VVGKSFWAAKLGRDALTIDWDDTHAEKRSSTALMEEYRALAEQPPTPRARRVMRSGDTRCRPQALGQLRVSVSCAAPMEPLDAVVKLTATSCEIWAGDQFQTIDQANAAKTAGWIRSR